MSDKSDHLERELERLNPAGSSRTGFVDDDAAPPAGKQLYFDPGSMTFSFTILGSIDQLKAAIPSDKLIDLRCSGTRCLLTVRHLLLNEVRALLQGIAGDLQILGTIEPVPPDAT